ncbi:MAG: helix-turn-helix domain-containing protein [Treponema sp.]|jgi:AraC-like DNA-binding protein/ligand-binding sensor protein|nr:helix-turn-helix domain-containing protein [Treponema sp.]
MNNTRSAGRVHQSEYQAQKIITPSSIIRRREIEPLLLKAEEALRLYEEATGIGVSVLDETGRCLPSFASQDAVRFCSLCRTHNQDKDRVWAEDEYPCSRMHYEAIAEAHRRGGVYIYVCNLGFTYWISPLTRSGRCAGACVAGGIIGIGRQECAARISAISQGAVSEEAASALLADIPQKSHDEIKSLARLLLICAEYVSKTSDSLGDSSAVKLPVSLAVKAVKQEASGPAIAGHAGGNPNGKADGKADGKAGGFAVDIANGSSEGITGAESAFRMVRYPQDKERMLLAALRRGDHDTAQKLLSGLLENLRSANPGDFRLIQHRAIELLALLSRAAVYTQEALDMNNRYLERIQDARNPEELTDILRLLVDRMAAQIFSYQGVRHASALRKAERFIWENYTRRVSLQEIASASGLSAPYFSSIFKQEMGESLSNYLNRLRVERAVSLLSGTNLSLSVVSTSCGFEDQSWFSKIFKSFTGVSPGKYREQGMSMPVDSAASPVLRESPLHEDA